MQRTACLKSIIKPMATPIAALLLCAADRADRVMVGGEWRVMDGQIPGLDVAGLIAEHSAAARRLVNG